MIKRMTIQELVKFCKKIKNMTPKKAEEEGLRWGLPRTYSVTLRSILGYIAKPQPKRYDNGLKNVVIEYIQNGGTMVQAAKDYNVNYSTVQRWCKDSGVDGNSRDFWTPIKIRQVASDVMKGVSLKDGYTRLQCSRSVYNCMRNRCVHKYQLSKERLEMLEKMGFYKWLENRVYDRKTKTYIIKKGILK